MTSRQIVATPTVCSSRPPAYEWWVGRRRQLAEPPAYLRVTEQVRDDGVQAGVRQLGREEVEEAVELVAVAPDRRGQRGGISVGRRLE